MPSIKIDDNSINDFCIMPNFVDINEYKKDKKLINTDIAEIGTMVNKIFYTNRSILKDLKEYNFNNMMVSQHQQLEIIMTIRDNEINNNWIKHSLEFSWFTKIFRKKYMRSEYEKIKQNGYSKFAPMIREINNSISEIKKTLKNNEEEE